MGWLALAAESGIKEWVELFNQLYAVNTKEEQAKFDKIIAIYKAKFGMKAQRVTCRKTQQPPSMRIITKCVKGRHFINKHDIDLIEPEL